MLQLLGSTERFLLGKGNPLGFWAMHVLSAGGSPAELFGQDAGRQRVDRAGLPTPQQHARPSIQQ